jgi:hypothetical protein
MARRPAGSRTPLPSGDSRSLNTGRCCVSFVRPAAPYSAGLAFHVHPFVVVPGYFPCRHPHRHSRNSVVSDYGPIGWLKWVGQHGRYRVSGLVAVPIVHPLPATQAPTLVPHVVPCLTGMWVAFASYLPRGVHIACGVNRISRAKLSKSGFHRHIVRGVQRYTLRYCRAGIVSPVLPIRLTRWLLPRRGQPPELVSPGTTHPANNANFYPHPWYWTHVQRPYLQWTKGQGTVNASRPAAKIWQLSLCRISE